MTTSILSGLGLEEVFAQQRIRTKESRTGPRQRCIKDMSLSLICSQEFFINSLKENLRKKYCFHWRSDYVEKNYSTHFISPS
jgi:hypothetical protein